MPQLGKRLLFVDDFSLYIFDGKLIIEEYYCEEWAEWEQIGEEDRAPTSDEVAKMFQFIGNHEPIRRGNYFEALHALNSAMELVPRNKKQ